MKHLFFTAILLLFTTIFLQAQIDIKVGGGFNSSHLTTESVDWKTEGRIGYQFGASVMVGNEWYFEPGAYWLTFTKDIVSANDPNENAFKNTIHSIRIPVYVGYHILGSEDTFADLRLFAGPGASFITSVNNDSDDLSKDDFKSMLFDVAVGAGVDVWFFFIEWQYMFGLTPVFSEGSDAKYQAFMGNLGFRLKL